MCHVPVTAGGRRAACHKHRAYHCDDKTNSRFVFHDVFLIVVAQRRYISHPAALTSSMEQGGHRGVGCMRLLAVNFTPLPLLFRLGQGQSPVCRD
jgi:hypothetical protein